MQFKEKIQDKVIAKLNLLLKIIPLLFLGGFSFALADTIQTPNTVSDIFYLFTESNLTKYVTVLITVALVTFLAGVVKFVGAGDNEEKRSQGRTAMIYGIIVMFVIFGMWGFVSILNNSFFDGEVKTPNYLPPLF